MFCIYLRTNSDLCHLQHKLIGFYNRDEKCLQRGTGWVFKSSGLRFVFKWLNIRFCWYIHKKVKGKVHIVQELGLCTGQTAHRGSRGIALLFLDHGTSRGEGSASRPGRSLPQGNTRYPLYRRLGGPQGLSEQVQKISPLTGIWSPERPVRSQSRYRLSYPDHWYTGSSKKWTGFETAIT